MTLGQLRTFHEVARAGSIRGAAAALVVSEPSVSAAVSSLGRDLGVQLLDRDGRGIRLTAAGRELAVYAAQILGLADRARRAVREAAGGIGQVRLVSVTTAGEYVLPPILAAFKKKRPDVQISLEVGNRAAAIERLLNDEADLAVGGRPPSGNDIVGIPFLSNELVVVGHNDHPLKDKRSIDAVALSKETWLLREPGSGTRETTEEFFALQGIEPTSIMTVGSNGAIKQAAVVGLGVTLISIHAVGRELRDGQLTHLKARTTPLRRSWYALHRAGAELPKSARDFLDFLSTDEAGRAVRRDPQLAAFVPIT